MTPMMRRSTMETLRTTSTTTNAVSIGDAEEAYFNRKDLYDPLGLYTTMSPERLAGRIRPLEPRLVVKKPIIDPMKLYPTKDSSIIDKDVIMSEALPFQPKPSVLDGTLAGDAGFDPFGFANSKESLLQLRESEIKHARIAMLAAVGWPLSELWDKPLASALGLDPLLGLGDRVPSLLNGGLAKVSPIYWVAVLAMASLWEVMAQAMQQEQSTNNGGFFDPLGLSEKFGGRERMESAEIKHGRLAMLAVTGFAVQEFVTKLGVIHETPMFFYPSLMQAASGVEGNTVPSILEALNRVASAGFS